MKTVEKFYTQTYSSVRSKSKKRGHPYPSFTKTELIIWLHNNNFQELWNRYRESNFDKDIRPSVDRIDDYKTYTFDNMQLITWRENRMKGCNSLKHKESTSKSNLKFKKTVFQYDKKLNLVAEYDSLKTASQMTNIHANDIQRVCVGTRKTSHGFYFSYTTLDKNFKKKKHKLSRSITQFTLDGEGGINVDVLSSCVGVSCVADVLYHLR